MGSRRFEEQRYDLVKVPGVPVVAVGRLAVIGSGVFLGLLEVIE
jgi:hypothetical protein